MSRYVLYNFLNHYKSFAGSISFKNGASCTGQLPKGKIVFYTMVRNMCNNSNIATFEQVKEARKNPNVIVIDVREPSELEETGIIPGSINIPSNNVESTFKNMSEEKFKCIYGRPKPSNDFSIIFTCRTGKRAEVAADLLKNLGFNNVKFFDGGWMEWVSQLSDVDKAFSTLPSEEFKKKYGKEKPTPDFPIIFSCKLGKRSQKALETIKKLGYQNVRNFEGGWIEWEEKNTKKR